MDEPQRYESAKRFASVTGFVLDIAILIYLVASGLSIRLRDFAETISYSPWIAVALYFVAVGAIFKAVDLTIGFYSGYLVEHRFGL